MLSISHGRIKIDRPKNNSSKEVVKISGCSGVSLAWNTNPTDIEIGQDAK